MAHTRTFSGYGELDSYGYNINAVDVYTLNVTRDLAGRITQRIENIEGTAVAWDYSYDEVGRLIEARKDDIIVESYTYDGNGNRLSETNTLRGIVDRTFSYSDEDHVLTAGTDAYQFDVDGFLTERTTATGTTTFHYSSRGELLEAVLPDSTVITYEHGSMGRRIAKKIDGVTVEKYLWQGKTKLLAVYDGSDNLISRFTYADDRMPVSIQKNGTTYYMVYDQVGTLRLVTDTSGNAVKQIDYDTFGNIINDSNPAFTVPFGYAGGLYDRDTDLTRFGARDYDPAIGRWTAKDPIDFAGGDTNLYGYVGNNSVNYTDPLGLYWFRQSWQTPGVVGRRDTPVPPRGPVSEFIEKYVPAGYTFGEMHDAFVGAATSAGFPDLLVNIPSMNPMYGIAIGTEVLRTLGIIDQPVPPAQPTTCK